ncbi:TRAP transporter large permease [Agrococcus sp. Ld7]|uniref:TRAP transporter large permease n=1 Tax=Agrococcus sp. Ld7 TaxID=649148 RepID=UPI00386A4E5D
MTLALLIAVMLGLLALRVPVWAALLAISVGYLVFEGGGGGPQVVQRLTSGLDSFPLLAVPFFILAGVVMAGGGVAERMMGFATTLVGHFRGGLAQVNVLNSLMIGGMSGSANADAAIDAKILVPIMRKQGYTNAFASAISVASGSISPILPPSIGLILYGVLGGVSIGDLFIGGVLPGILIAIALSTTVWVLARVHKFPRANERRPTLREIWRGFRRTFAALLMPVLLLVGLRLGIMTPTELGAVLVVYALILSMYVYKTITWRDIPSLLREAVLITGVVMIIIAAASVFAIVVAYERIPDQLSGFLLGISDNPIIVMLIINLILLVLGIFLESSSLMIILVPVLAPLAVQLGIDPVQFGIIIVLNLSIGSLTPPVGTVVYTVAAITRVSIPAFVRAFTPLFLALVVVLLAVTFIPVLSTWLPAVL